MESCPGKTVMAGGMGFVLGGAFGLFMSSVSDSLLHLDLSCCAQGLYKLKLMFWR